VIRHRKAAVLTQAAAAGLTQHHPMMQALYRLVAQKVNENSRATHQAAVPDSTAPLIRGAKKRFWSAKWEPSVWIVR
jgi:hypothetical protein